MEPTVSDPTAQTLDQEPYGSCTAHGLQLRQYASPCDQHPVIDDVECLVVLVACAQGCELTEFHS